MGAAAGGAGGMAALPATAHTGVSTVNPRLPSAGGVGYAGKGGAPLPAGQVSSVAALQIADEDSEDEPDAKKPRLDDGSLESEANWLVKHPMPIQILVQVNLGADAAAANVPAVIPLELTVRTKILEMKHMLAPKVSAAGVNAGTMTLKAQSQ